MTERLYVGTRKGLFEIARERGEWEVAAAHFLGDPVSAVLAEPDGRLYAALDLGHFGAKLWRRDGDGRMARNRRPGLSAKARNRHGRPASVVARPDLGIGAGRPARPAVGRHDAGRALPIRGWRRELDLERGAVADARAPAVGRRGGRRAARHLFGTDRPARPRRHPRRRLDRRRLGQHRQRRLVADHQPRHARRLHAAGTGGRADRPGRASAGALRGISRDRLVPAP